MALDAEPPEPPALESMDPEDYDDVEVVGSTDYRRDEIQDALEDGAWEDAFEQWRRETDMDEPTLGIVEDLGLFREFDFFWDEFADRIGYHAPGVPEDWKERGLHEQLDSWERASTINAELTELGQLVCDVLRADYVEFESDYEAPDDLPDFQ